MAAPNSALLGKAFPRLFPTPGARPRTNMTVGHDHPHHSVGQCVRHLGAGGGVLAQPGAVKALFGLTPGRVGASPISPQPRTGQGVAAACPVPVRSRLHLQGQLRGDEVLDHRIDDPLGRACCRVSLIPNTADRSGDLCPYPIPISAGRDRRENLGDR